MTPVLGLITKALSIIGRPPTRVAVVSGIGCSPRHPAYTTCHGFTPCTAARPPPALAEGQPRPDGVVVTGGDGDGYRSAATTSHARWRNLDLTYIVVMDNHVYGTTKGRASPTTEPDWDNKPRPAAPASVVPPAGDRVGGRRQLLWRAPSPAT